MTAPAAAAAELRRSVADLAAVAQNSLRTVWAQVTTAQLAAQALQETLPPLVETYGLAAAAVAADWYDNLRDEQGAKGRFTAIPAEVTDTGADVLARWGVAPLFAAEPDWAAAATLIAGGLQRRIANAARDTITFSSVQDPAAAGWKRVGDGHTCDFCTLLLGRGYVYTKATATFQAHDHDGCTAAPEWR